MAAYKDKRDLIAIGAYERGTDPLTDRAIDLRDRIDGFLRQRVDEPTPGEQADADAARASSAAAPRGDQVFDAADRASPCRGPAEPDSAPRRRSRR